MGEKILVDQATTCKEKAQVIDEIAALETKESRATLRRALDKVVKKSWEKERYRHACVRKQISAHLENKPGNTRLAESQFKQNY